MPKKKASSSKKLAGSYNKSRESNIKVIKTNKKATKSDTLEVSESDELKALNIIINALGNKIDLRDDLAIKMFAIELASYLKLNEAIKIEGYSTINDRGQRVKTPEAQLLDASFKRVAYFLNNFGLTSLAQMKIEMNGDEEDEELEEIKKKLGLA